MHFDFILPHLSGDAAAQSEFLFKPCLKECAEEELTIHINGPIRNTICAFDEPYKVEFLRECY